MTGFDPQEFGRVLARLDAQDKTLARLEQDMHELAKSVEKLMRAVCADPREKKEKRDWLEIFASAIFGAVCYFIGAKLIG